MKIIGNCTAEAVAVAVAWHYRSILPFTVCSKIRMPSMYLCSLTLRRTTASNQQQEIASNDVHADETQTEPATTCMVAWPRSNVLRW